MATISTYTRPSENRRVPVFQLQPGDMMLGLGEVLSTHRVDTSTDHIVVVWRSQIMADDIVSEVWPGRKDVVVVRARPEERITLDLSMAEARHLHALMGVRSPLTEDLGKLIP